ncbi:transcription termination factor Rho-like [Megalobrama amblycephala]|uniref:transcription termination factor Rho-like n=1 Tax=Megalobrama amblycephala TaxID=75352 RepID=UPI002014792C|nr:transcription termination factor Rho-like [Megalobrama amblycephala]
MSSGNRRGLRVRGGGQGRGRRGRGDRERGDRERERRAEDVGGRAEDVGGRARRAEDVGRGEKFEEMDRLEGNGIVERENIRRGGQGGRGGQRGRGDQDGRGGRRGRMRVGYTRVSNEIRATLIDHVINHGLSLREAGQRVQPNINKSTVASIIRTFQRENRIEVREHSGGRTRLFSVEQEHAIVDMVVQNNTLRLKEIQQRITQDNQLFHNIHQCRLSTIDRVLRRNAIRMKQVYKVPFERNSIRVKELRFQFVQGDQGQMVWNFVVVWDNVQFHHSALVQEWFENHPQFRMVFLPPYSPFLNPIEEFFSSWRWKVHDRNPYNQM